jgi:O-methyltransferase involved in polyketide biosynthesis
MIHNPHEKVGPTAWGIAYRRAGCDILFAKEIFDELVKVMTPEEKKKMEALTSEKDQALTPQFEARYKLLNRLLRKTGIKQIVELAAGIAPRGIEMTQDQTVTYIEVDLPGIIKQKKEIIDALVQQKTIHKPSNLHLISGSALDDVVSVSGFFDTTKPVAVIHEGLMRYLTFEEKSQVVENVKKILKKFGGVYITPDITLKVFIDEHVQTLFASMIGMDINANAFENIEAAEKFFGDLGFVIEKHSFTEARDELVSPKQLNLSEEQINNAIGDPVFFLMKLRQ